MRGVIFKCILVVFLACLMTTPATAENVLRWASQGDPLTYDPHSANESPTRRIRLSSLKYQLMGISRIL